MKYSTGVIVIVVLAAGAFLGFNALKSGDGQSSASTNTGSTAALSSSANAKVLDLGGRGLTKVTSDVYSKTATTDLILSNNALKSLPTEMGKMSNVAVLKLDHNQLEGSLIGEVRQMAKLRLLDASYNNMTGIPAEIGQLRNLEQLDYSHNAITGLPNELANLKGTLKKFDLTGNPLSQGQIDSLRAALPGTEVVF